MKIMIHRCAICDEVLWSGVLVCGRCFRIGIAAAIALGAGVLTLAKVGQYK